MVFEPLVLGGIDNLLVPRLIAIHFMHSMLKYRLCKMMVPYCRVTRISIPGGQHLFCSYMI